MHNYDRHLYKIFLVISGVPHSSGVQTFVFEEDHLILYFIADFDSAYFCLTLHNLIFNGFAVIKYIPHGQTVI